MNSPHHISSFTTNRIFTAFKLNQRGWPISPLRMPDSLPWVFFAATIFGVNHCISESALCKLHNLILGLKRRGGIHTKETRSERDTCTPMFIVHLIFYCSSLLGSFQVPVLYSLEGSLILPALHDLCRVLMSWSRTKLKLIQWVILNAFRATEYCFNNPLAFPLGFPQHLFTSLT